MERKNERPMELKEVELKKVSGGFGCEQRMICKGCGAATSDPQMMSHWLLTPYFNKDGVPLGYCEKCSRDPLKSVTLVHEEK